MVGDSKTKAVIIPGIRHTTGDDKIKKKGIQELKSQGKDADKEKEHDGTRYRGLAARANFLAIDKIDIQHAVKEICRRMSSPAKQDWEKMIRLAQYLKGKPRMASVFPEGGASDEITCCTDTDWAGCRTTRRSTSGGVITWGGCVIKSWSTTQAVVALSSGEAELYGLVKGSSEGAWSPMSA